MKTLLEATILVQAGLGIAALPAGMEGKLAREVSVFAIEGDSSASAPWPCAGGARETRRPSTFSR